MNNSGHDPFQNPHHHGHHPGHHAPYGIPGKGKGIASMVCGIFSLAFPIPFLGLAAAIAGLILASSAARDGYVGGMRTAGLVCSIIGVVFGALAALSIMTIAACIPFMMF